MRTLRIAIVPTLLALAVLGAIPRAQTGVATQTPTTRAEAGAWSAAIVRKAAAMIASPEQWDKAGSGDCPVNVKSVSLICALQKAADMAAPKQPAHSECRFQSIKDGEEGACGVLFDEVPIFTVSRVPAITSGAWRTDAKPSEVWAGTMSDAASPVMYEARQLVNEVTTKKYPARLIGYNNDPATTWDDLKTFFRLLEARVMRNGAADLDKATDDVEIEIYPGGTGVARTYAGWFPVSGFAGTNAGVGFQLDGLTQVPPNAVDREILKRAAGVITSEAVWNRADDRKCPTAATTWSIYCAVQKAQIEVAGGFHHRRPAGEVVREIVEARSAARSYQHRMMDYNNDPTTRLADVQSLFAEALARIK